MQLGKFNSDRDSALHYLCRAEWCNESFGDVSEYGLFIDRISNTWEDVKPGNTEFRSVIEGWLESESVNDLFELRKSLVGHFLVIENDAGQVTVVEYGNEATLIQAFNEARDRYDVWATQFDPIDGDENPSPSEH